MTTLDPHLLYATIIRSAASSGSIFDSLVRRRPDGTHEPRLALGWEQPTPTTWLFHLRPGVHFQNGEAFDSHAVVASVERMNVSPFNGESQLWQQTNLRQVAALDPLTVTFTTDGPALTMLYWLEEAFIAPPRYLAETSAAIIGAHPIGSGPYRFVEWQQGDHVTLIANDDHWAGPPAIRDVIFRAVPEQSSRLNELKAGSVDLVPCPDPDNAGSADSALSHAAQVPGLRKMHMGFSQSGIAALKDRRVRQAINYAVDVATMIGTLERGMAAPMASVVNPPNNDPSLHPFPYDPAKAAALLREAGHAGLRGGNRLRFEICRCARKLRRWWRRISVRSACWRMSWPMRVRPFRRNAAGARLSRFVFLRLRRADRAAGGAGDLHQRRRR